MRNLALIIDNNTVADNGIVKRTTVNGGTGSDLNAIANDNATKLRDLNPITTIVSVAKTVRTNHCAGLNEAIFADFNFVVDGHIGPQTCPGADFCVFPNEAARADDDVIAQYDARLDHGICADCYVVTQLSRRIDCCTGSNVLRRLRRGIKNLCHASIRQVGIFHYQCRTSGKRKIVLRQNNSRRLALSQMFTVLRAYHEGNIASFSRLHGRNSGDDDIAITV